MSDPIVQTETYTLYRGSAPLLVSLPHDGSEIPRELSARMGERARTAPDTDWHVSRLYAFARDTLGASMLVPRYSRYVVDLNRPPDDASLYPGQNTTGLCPVRAFSGEPIYRDGEAPADDEIATRRTRYWQPYHDALAAELARLRDAHARVLLWEGHSIRGSGLPFLFEGRLPDLNVGTAGGTSCVPSVADRIRTVLSAQHDYDWVVDGRFQGGYITRHYGRPDAGADAVQLEISQRIYMDEATLAYDPDRARKAQALIRELLQAAVG
jgi:N-formylglutamate deformylase